MRRWTLLLALAGTLLVGTLAAQGGPAAEPQLHTALPLDIQQPVEQQTPGGATQPDRDLWVINPFRAIAWDADDQVTFVGQDARLTAGEMLVVKGYSIGDWAPHLWVIDAGVTSNRLVTLALHTSPGVERLIVGQADDGHARYCLIGPRYDTDVANPHLTPVPDSNGGVGALTIVAATLWNVDHRAIRDARLTVRVQLDSSISLGLNCGSVAFPPALPWDCYGAGIGDLQPQWCWKRVD